ncbi:S1C family serine protease [Phenylobacterium sp.]|jgi:S1-C subfamily serine protease|uniref:S1C family serine protease n=1 Tax=Phenylobacterium sp. TaxID=1871053 RepID=UPI002E308700|nr:trypsin-like peptidase domain-containing protein [Phenylobacterium sp.]HEX3367783.1 trypsin-like peptidase domain-containing protein [Phenylobacterium sp.]
MRPWTSLAVFAAFALVLSAGAAQAADAGKLKNLQAPPAIAAPTLPHDARAVKFAKMVVQLKPEPWAFLRNKDTLAEDRLISWQDGQKAINPQLFAQIFDEELKKASGKAVGANGLFAADPGPPPELLVAVKVTDMQGRFCKSCGLILSSGRWEGAVVITAHWEVYSTAEQRVVAAADITGGFNSPSKGVDGDPERLIDEAFRDNVRRLLTYVDFRRAVTGPAAAPVSTLPSPASQGALTLVAAKPKPGIAQASLSVALVISPSGSGSGFLVSDDGLLITNHHVVGAANVVRLKWPDGGETVGEVLRSDPRRDVALVRTAPGGRAALGLRHTTAQQGETVFAIGSPLGAEFQNTMSKGIVSALRNQQGLSYIQSDVMVNHGSSGGPLLDETGRVIGLTASGQIVNGAPVGINFFIPIDEALKTLNLTAPPETPVQQADRKP